MKHILVLAAAFAVASAAPAQPLADPTRPAAVRMPGAGGPIAAAVPGAQPEPVASIVIAGAGRQFAIVDGHLVRVGETYNGSRLQSVSLRGAVWQKATLRTRASQPVAQRKSPATP